MLSGTVALIGRPNAGKSSLVNAILKTRAVIVSSKPQTTRNVIKCIYNDDESQIIFTDTPGLYKIKNSSDKLGEFFSNSISEFLGGIDLICWLVDAGNGKLNDDDLEIISLLKANSKIPVILVATKCDKYNPERVFDIYTQAYKFNEKISVSSRKNTGIQDFINLVKKYIPEGELLFDTDILMTSTEKFMASEIIRGQILKLFRDEVPHCVAVEVNDYKSPDEFPERKNLYISANLIIETEGQKKILIGKNGAMIKKIGVLSRKELEEVTGFSVYLDLWVKIIPNWRKNFTALKRLGYA